MLFLFYLFKNNAIVYNKSPFLKKIRSSKISNNNNIGFKCNFYFFVIIYCFLLIYKENNMKEKTRTI
jgi:hypothetical protein